MAVHPTEALAVYALGALLPEEERRVEAHLERCAECRAELVRLRGAADSVALTAPPATPPVSVRERLLARVAADRATKQRAAGGETAGARDTERTESTGGMREAGGLPNA